MGVVYVLVSIMREFVSITHFDKVLSTFESSPKGTTAWRLNLSFGVQIIVVFLLSIGTRKRCCGFGRCDACAKAGSSRPRGNFVAYGFVS